MAPNEFSSNQILHIGMVAEMYFSSFTDHSVQKMNGINYNETMEKFPWKWW